MWCGYLPVSIACRAIFLLWLGLAPAAHALKEVKNCNRMFRGLVTRNLHAEQKLIDAVERVFRDSLLRELELKHLREVNHYNDSSPKTWKKFSPTWILNSPETLDRVLEHFDPSDESNPRYPGTIHEWVASWENGYHENFGTVAKSWIDGGRKHFLQTLLVEGAVRYAQRKGMGQNPEFFLTSPHETAPFVNELSAGILIAFGGNMKLFQSEFDQVWRRRSGGSLAGAAAQVPPVEQQTRQQLRDAGVYLSKLRDWRPRITAAARTREAEMDVQLVVESVREFGSAALPLGGLLREGTEGALEHEQTQFSWQPLTNVVNRHGGVMPFMRKVNGALHAAGLEPISPQSGATTLAQEIVIQGATLAAVAVGATTQSLFTGFQAQKIGGAMYLEMDAEIIKRSGLKLIEINRLVKQRLPN